MNKETWREYKHEVFFFQLRQIHVKEFSKDSTLTIIVQTQPFLCLFTRYGANLYVGSHPCISLSGKGVSLKYAITMPRL